MYVVATEIMHIGPTLSNNQLEKQAGKKMSSVGGCPQLHGGSPRAAVRLAHAYKFAVLSASHGSW
jgi:hypothetical protein